MNWLRRMAWRIFHGTDGRQPISSISAVAYPTRSQTHLLIDEIDRVIGVLYGQPRDLAGWQKANRRALKLLRKASTYFTARTVKPHRRGTFPSVAHGISFGGGQQVSANQPCQSI